MDSDGAFCYPVLYQGTHILTIGISVCKYGLLLNQVQRVKEVGNRLPLTANELLLHVVSLLHELCITNSVDLFIVDGVSKAAGVYESYGEHKPEVWPEELQKRIARFYDQDLPGFKRTEKITVNANDVFSKITYQFHKLERH